MSRVYTCVCVFVWISGNVRWGEIPDTNVVGFAIIAELAYGSGVAPHSPKSAYGTPGVLEKPADAYSRIRTRSEPRFADTGCTSMRDTPVTAPTKVVGWRVAAQRAMTIAEFI